jgi:predicted DNA-binding transcriptional regulator AlpA
MDPNAAAAAVQLGITLTALWALMRNPQFPAPTSNDGAGNINWTSASINAFQALMTSAKSNGWIVTVAAYPTANWSMMAATPIGPYYQPALADPLFDL